MKNNQYRIVFHTDRGYGMIIAVGMKDITVQYEDGSCDITSPINPDLVILPRFGEMIRVCDDFGECGVERTYIGYNPNNQYHISTDSNVYKHFSFIDEPKEAEALHPVPEITTEHIGAVLRYLTDHFKED